MFHMIAFDVGRTLPKTDFSQDFIGLVVNQSIHGSVDGSWDDMLPGNSERKT